MKVSDLQPHELFTAQADESLEVAADRMSWHQVGALPVLDGQRLVGIITERDLTAALAEDADPRITPVSDYMTPAPEVLRPDSELAEAAQLMLELGIRHLPVVRGGRLVGVLSIRDLLDAVLNGARTCARGRGHRPPRALPPLLPRLRDPDRGRRPRLVRHRQGADRP
jgi:CBS domain-containing protein